ncbi:hypothetical protein Dsin_005794 [Dipteronia sinensis]|uniref:Endonuclease/exonuclease/phosphatase n=1 Tax=Dipteronia sinensis TaxID=43782 RepID=A0AAE0AXH9_9ROSI|nr:hypothetical protein Dsin_005794 [Dipteronia sinensis]
MIIDGPSVGPEPSTTISDHLLEDVVFGPLNESGESNNKEHALFEWEDGPNKPSPETIVEVQKHMMISEQHLTPKKNFPMRWKRSARGGEQHQIVGNVTSPLQRMLEASKMARKVSKLYNSSPLITKKSPVKGGEAVEDYALADIGFSGPMFTWNNKRDGKDNIQEILDRFLANFQWRDQFPNNRVEHLGFNSSDHRPILLMCSLVIHNKHFEERKFRFE